MNSNEDAADYREKVGFLIPKKQLRVTNDMYRHETFLALNTNLLPH